MKKFARIREDFLAGRLVGFNKVLYYITVVGTYIICLINLVVSSYVMDYLSISSPVQCVLLPAIAFSQVALFYLDNPISRFLINIYTRITLYFARYGNVISSRNWKKMKRRSRKIYRDFWSPGSSGHSYFYSRWLAYYSDAQILYLAIRMPDGTREGHAVVYKNGCVFDPNAKIHYDYEEYMEMVNGLRYRMFDSTSFCKDSFFDDIRKGFVIWCKTNGVHCSPQVSPSPISSFETT